MPYHCPAKLNLFLGIEGLLPGGFHSLSTLMQRIGLCDELEILPNRSGNLVLRCDISPTEKAEDNLVLKAARLLKERAGIRELGADILLKKRIPWGAGLGGGSSDAAGTLKYLNELWGLKIPLEELSSLAARIGSDAPFFLGPPAAFCTGRGEIVKAVKPRELYLLLFKPSESLSTPRVYRQYDQWPRNSASPEAFLKAYAEGDLDSLGKALFNDLEAPARELLPALDKYLASIRELTPYAAMSGSGTALFGLFKDLSSAGEAGLALSGLYPDASLTVTKTLIE